EQLDILLYGSNGEKIFFRYENEFGAVRENYVVFEGVVRNVERRFKETTSEFIREQMQEYMTEKPCQTCKGYRLKKEALAVKINGKHIGEVTDLSIHDAIDFFQNLELTDKERAIGNLILREILDRLGFLKNVGLEYLTLSRSAGTLSGGEAQRIRLATQVGS